MEATKFLLLGFALVIATAAAPVALAEEGCTVLVDDVIYPDSDCDGVPDDGPGSGEPCRPHCNT